MIARTETAGCFSYLSIVHEAQASSTRFELFFQNAILFDQVGDHARLLTAYPGGERRQEELQVNGASHAGSVSDLRQVIVWQRDPIFGHYAPRIVVCGKAQESLFAQSAWLASHGYRYNCFTPDQVDSLTDVTTSQDTFGSPLQLRT